MNMFGRTRILKVDPTNPQEKAIKLAADIIKEGGIVAFPTETVYGLAADYLNKSAVKRIYEVKNRPKTKPLTLQVADVGMLKAFVAEIPHLAERLMELFWPGPLTIILMSKKGKKIGFRIPRNEIALQLIRACGQPIVAPSANPTGAAPPKNAGDVIKMLNGRIDMVLDGGGSEIGRESTVIDATVFPCQVLREGAISKSRISDAWHSE